MLVLEDLTVAMGDGTLQADLCAEAGARIAVLGPSGAGKSTLLDAVAGFRAARSGRILWQGRALTTEPPDRRPVSILFQDGNLFPHLTVARNLGLALDATGRRPGATAQARIAEALGAVGLDGYGDRKPGALSGGQQGRAALARVLLQERPILLLDEPFAALGPALKAEMLALVGRVADALGALTLMVTHDPADARAFAQQVIFVSDGVAEPPAETGVLLDDPPAALRAYLGAPTARGR